MFFFGSFMRKGLLVASLALTSNLVAADSAAQQSEKKVPTREELFSPGFIQKLSETYGHLIAKSLENPMIKLDTAMVIKGIQDAKSGKTSPLTDREYEEAFTLIQQYAFEEKANQNLKAAETFLAKNASEAGIVEIEAGKIQYKIVQEGTGEVVTTDVMPTINYVASFSAGTDQPANEQQGGPIDINLDETIPGFSKGLLGMKVGEKRKLFIHPEFAYGAQGPVPNGLLVFDIELIKVSPKPAPSDDDDDFLADDDDDDFEEEEFEEIDEEDEGEQPVAPK